MSKGIIIWEPNEIPKFGGAALRQLVDHDPDSWSGVTIREGSRTAIILNPTHPKTRQTNTLMHEWPHLELRHKPNRVDIADDEILLLSDYPPELEAEADWLAGAALIPRDGLIQRRLRGQTVEQIAADFGVSIDLAQWRLRMTGVDRQLRYAR